MSTAPSSRRSAVRFILALGLVSLFADMTYEGARAIIGPYLQRLGASGFEMGLVIGLGEMCAASLRFFSGRLADRTRRYWTLAIAGYAVNLVAVPALAFAGHWAAAALLVIAERSGKALRGPARDVLLSQATAEVGHGWGFGLHQAMDQTGAVLGPLWVALAVASSHSFRRAFLPLALPAAAALTALLVARAVFHARAPEPVSAAPHDWRGTPLPSSFWLYTAAAALLAFGYLDFPFFAYYWVKLGLFANASIPLLYALAMGLEGAFGLAFGRLFDRAGILVLSCASLIALFALPLGFLGGTRGAIAAVVCWALGTGAQGACLKPAVAAIASMDKRGRAFGNFNGVWGVAWFCGSGLLGFLLDRNLALMIAVSVAAQAVAACALLALRARLRPRPVV